jgi:hypothetical protein
MLSNKFFQLTYQAVHNALIASKYIFHGFDDDILSEGKENFNWPLKMEIIVTGQNPTDNLFCPLKPWLLVSNKVKTALEDIRIQGIQFLPIHVVHQSGIEIPKYSILNIISMVEGLDYERSKWSTVVKWNVEYPQLDILEIVINCKAVDRLDIFRITESKTQIFVSKRFKQCLENNQSSLGFKFIPVQCT